jgi:ATP synthase protein I
MPDPGKDAAERRGEISPEDRQAIRDRAQDLGKRLDEVKARRSAEAPQQRRGGGGFGGPNMGLALRFAADLVAGVGVGGFIGWALDRQFGTSPWLLALFVIFGFAAGLLNVIRAARRMQAEAEPLQRAAPSVKSDDDET